MFIISSSSLALISLSFGVVGENLLFDGLTIMGKTLALGLWLGSFQALGAGIIDIISGVLLYSSD